MRDVRRTGGERGLRGEEEKIVDRASPDRRKQELSVSTPTNQRTTAAQDEGGWRKEAELEAERCMEK